MNINNYGQIVQNICEECYSEALQKVWDSSRPDWIIRYPDNDLGIRVCPEYLEWRKDALQVVTCFHAEIPQGDTLFVLCPKHMMDLVRKVIDHEPT